ncbi:IS1249 family transposase [Eggerthellaceae bacterium zg-893]|nr:IS1249 family transposase [Eggerthellaceae bacterium zg-893]
MGSPKCQVCGSAMKKNGKTKAGTQRWRCKSCDASFVRKIDNTAKLLRMFVRWLLGKPSQTELDISARTFRALTGDFWKIWPILPACDETHHVVYMDGIWLARNKAVLLIACTDEYVIGCHLAKSESSKDWACLMQRIAPPDALVCDGGGGIEKARRTIWPRTRAQRCTFHAFEQVKRCTTARPKLQAGVELYGIAKDLLSVKSREEATLWLVSFSDWCATWDDFLKERTIADGKSRYKHERLRKARRGLEKLCRAETLFTYLDEDLTKDGPVSAASNKIESLNSQIRAVFRNHRGMNIDHRIKAGFWFCYMRSEAPSPFAQMLKEFPTDTQVMEWRRQAAKADQKEGDAARWGQGVVWSELHMRGSKATGWF